MNDLKLLRLFGDALAGSDVTAPADLRERVLRRATSGGNEAVRRVRRGLRLSLAPGLALAAALAVALAGSVHASLGGPHGSAMSTARTGEPARVLHHAALVAEHDDAVIPRPDQFVFIEASQHFTMQVQQADGTFKTVDNGAQVRQVWLAADGRAIGQMRTRLSSNLNGWTALRPVDAGAVAYQRDLPTSPAAMLAWLYANSQGDNQRDEQAFITASDLVASGALSPRQQASLYEAVAKIPGITIIPDLTDLTGRHGIAIGMGHLDPSNPAAGRSAPIPANAMIFDAATYVYLGSGNTAVLRQAVVDRPGQLP